MERSALVSNGLRVASQETYGQLCNFRLTASCCPFCGGALDTGSIIDSLFLDAGSRSEPIKGPGRGAAHLMELMAFKSTLVSVGYRRVVASKHLTRMP